MSCRAQLFGAALCVVLAACANDPEPARRALGEVSARLAATSAEARKYAPDGLATVQAHLDDLRTRFDSKDYAGVVGNAPAVLREAHELGAAVAAKKALATTALNERWAVLAAALPADAAAIRQRIEALQKPPRARRPATDLDAARASLSECASTWSKGQAAFAAGNMTEAVAIGEQLMGQQQALAASLQMELPSPGVPTAAP